MDKRIIINILLDNRYKYEYDYNCSWKYSSMDQYINMNKYSNDVNDKLIGINSYIKREYCNIKTNTIIYYNALLNERFLIGYYV